MKNKLIIVFITFLTFSFGTNAQEIIGFWKVDKVTVGDENLTPVAKWFKYHKDKTYQSGNGWTQNDIGTWAYDKSKNEFKAQTSMGIKDEYEVFKVRFADNKMFWDREEDGTKVMVTLTRIKEMPMSAKDSISGLWDLITVTKDGKEITQSYDPENKERLHMQTTEKYRITNPDGTQAFGFWHMNAHTPELHLIDFDQNVAFKVFNVSFKDDLLLMKPKSNENMVFVYKRK